MPTVSAFPAPAESSSHLDDPTLYLNRELTWLKFNRRVLAEAENEASPLLERLKFLAIFDSNLDEFFMKRIGGLKQQVGAGLQTLSLDGRTAYQQIEACEAQVAEDLADRAFVYRDVMQQLERSGVRVLNYDDLDDEHQTALRARYEQSILPLVTPLAIDEAHPFPFISNLSVNLLLQIHDANEIGAHLVRIKVPTSRRTPRLLPTGTPNDFVLLEQVIERNLDLLLPGAEILSCGFFRVTRNAIVERDEENANDLLEMIETELRDRRFAPVVRLEVSHNLPAELRDYLARELRLTGPADVFEVADMLATRDLMQLTSLNRPDLKYPPFEPAPHPRLSGSRSLFAELIENGPLLLKHPYQSYDHTVTRLLREAVEDPKVLAIKTTVYRTSDDSAIVPLLIEAVTSGKQVAVVVELQARFDEAANIRWANRLEEAGIHVSYGMVGYKTHAKATLILRESPDGRLTRFVHLGTGNYHAVTARQYCDIGLMTAEESVTADAMELFNLLTSGSLSGRTYHELLVSPLQMKTLLLEKIRREIDHQRSPRKDGWLQLKTNALEDSDITRALYEATSAGVKVDLIVRDSCRFRPGVAGLSETGSVISILGRFLEHARLYYFHNGGDEEYYIGSADLMTRNLESRVEALVPIRTPNLQAELRELLDLQVNDPYGAWEMDASGNYEKRSDGSLAQHSQSELTERARLQRTAIASDGG